MIQFSGSANGGTLPYSYYWDLDNDGEYDDANESNAEKSWETEGTYTIGIMVIDDKGKNDTDTAQVTITIENTKPDKPETPSGETSGSNGNEYTYSSSTTDPQNDQVYYLWDFGDGTNSGWLGPYNSGLTVEVSHTWEEEGTYEIKVRAKDTSGLLSDWSDPLSISMPRNRIVNAFILFLQKIMQKFPIIEKIISSTN